MQRSYPPLVKGEYPADLHALMNHIFAMCGMLGSIFSPKKYYYTDDGDGIFFYILCLGNQCLWFVYASQKGVSDKLSAEERDLIRADMLRERLKNVSRPVVK